MIGRRRDAALCLLIFGLILLVYFPSLNGPLVFDDADYVRNNPLLGNPRWIVFPQSFEPWPAVPENIRLSYRSRQLGHLSLWLSKEAGSEGGTLAFHLGNVLLHFLNALLLFGILRRLWQSPAPSAMDARSPPAVREGFNLAVVFLFALHPVQTQAVSYISQRFTVLVAFFFLLSVLCYLEFRMGHEKRGRSKWLFHALAIVAALLAMRTKENAFVLPFMLLLLELAFSRGRAGRRLGGVAPFFLVALVVPLSLINYEGSLPVALDLASRTYVGSSRVDYLLTQGPVVAHYIRLLFYPEGLRLDYAWPFAERALEPAVLGSFALHIGLIGLSVWLIARGRKGAFAPWGLIAGFGMLWFYLALSVESSVFPLADACFEHRVYLPSAGFFAAAVAGALRVVPVDRKIWRRRVLAVFLIVCLLLFGVKTWQRNTLWADPLSLWADTVRKEPLNARAHGGLANELLGAGRYDLAIGHYRTAISLDPAVSAESHNNLGSLYARRGSLLRAAEHFNHAINLKPGYQSAWFNLAVLYLRLDLPGEALLAARRAVELDPEDREARRLLELLEKEVDGRTGEVIK